MAEDSPDNQALICSYLDGTPYQVEVAENGGVACEKYEGGQYDLVLMDMQMPVMDGYAAARAMRDWEQKTGRPPVPIVALTASALKEQEIQSLASGCSARLTKPINRQTLLHAIQAHTAEGEP